MLIFYASKVCGKRKTAGNTSFDIYMATSETLPLKLQSLKLEGNESSAFLTLTSLKKSWRVKPQVMGKLIAHVDGETTYRLKEQIDPNLYYYFQVRLSSMPATVDPESMMAKLNFEPPARLETQATSQDLTITWPEVAGASSYLVFSDSERTKLLYTVEKSNLNFSYEALPNLQNICIVPKRGDLITQSCIDLEVEIPGAPVKSVTFPVLYSNQSQVDISWDDWDAPTVASYEFKMCRDSSCKDACSAEQKLTDKTVTFAGLAEHTYYACVLTKRKNGKLSPWIASAKPLVIERTPPLVNAGADRVSAAPIAVNATTTNAVSWQWTKESGPGALTFTAPTSEDTMVTAGKDGIYIVRLTVTDRAGNTAISDFKYTRDTTAPVFGGIKTLWQQSPSQIMIFWDLGVDALAADDLLTYEVCVSAVRGA